MNRYIEERIVKIPLPIPLIREIDEALVSRLGGYSTRTEFFRDAAEGLLLELKYEPAPAEPTTRSEPERSPTRSSETLVGESTSANRERNRSSEDALTSLDATVLHLDIECEALAEGEADVDDAPLFGMHNRDYPSLWVAFRLAERSGKGPVPYDSFARETIEEAWCYAENLRNLEESQGTKLTALFPTNRAKPQSSADAFKAFAIGSLIDGGHGRLRAEGPLFSWRVCQVVRPHGSDALIGLTSDGLKLLRDLDGLSLRLPHASSLARAFLDHLQHHSPGDWWGFRTLVQAVANDPTRPELVETFQQKRPDWSSNVAATNAQGYLARAREWGLVQPKQHSGRYALTKFGSEYLLAITQDINANSTD